MADDTRTDAQMWNNPYGITSLIIDARPLAFGVLPFAEMLHDGPRSYAPRKPSGHDCTKAMAGRKANVARMRRARV